MKTNLLTSAVVAASVLAGAAHAENTRTNVPSELVAEVLANASSKSGEIAVAQVEGTNTYIVYLKTRGTCGSGGCRAQVWQKTDTGFESVDRLPVGHLPIREMPRENGAVKLSITSYDNNGQMKTIPVIAGADGFEANWTKTVNASAGRVLISQDMLKQF